MICLGLAFILFGFVLSQVEIKIWLSVMNISQNGAGIRPSSSCKYVALKIGKYKMKIFFCIYGMFLRSFGPTIKQLCNTR